MLCEQDGDVLVLNLRLIQPTGHPPARARMAVGRDQRLVGDRTVGGEPGAADVQTAHDRATGDAVAAPRRIRVAVIEGHPLYRAAVERVLAGAEFVELGAVVASMARFHVHQQPPGSVVLLGPGLPGVVGAAAVLEVCELGHHVLVVSAQTEPVVVLSAIAAGASGVLPTDVDPDELLIAIKTVAGGGAYLPPWSPG